MDNDIKGYIASVVPSNISDRRRKLLSDELESHIYDKIDHYEEIGYTKEQSIKKALEEMGEGEEVKRSINNSFDELYHEKGWLAFLAFVVICLFNFLSFIFDTWVFSIDSNSFLNDYSVIISSLMVGFVIWLIGFARRNKYKKTLLAVAIANSMIGISFFFDFYPQAAFYSVGSYMFYIIECFTPFSIISIDVADNINECCVYYGTFVFLFVTSIYCFVASGKLLIESAREIKNPRKSAVRFNVVLTVIIALNCILYPFATNYIGDYPDWFVSTSNEGFSAEVLELYSKLESTEDYDEAAYILKNAGYTTTEEYKKTLSRKSKKQFKTRLKEIKFLHDSYEFWFAPTGNTDNAVSLFIKKDDNGKLVGVGIEDGYNTGTEYSNYDFSHYCYRDDNIQKCKAEFEKLRLGDKEEAVMGIFGKKYGDVFTKFSEKVDGKTKHFYRVHCGNNDAEYIDYYFDFTFENGLLIEGKLNYEQGLEFGDYVLKSETVN